LIGTLDRHLNLDRHRHTCASVRLLSFYLEDVRCCEHTRTNSRQEHDQRSMHEPMIADCRTGSCAGSLDDHAM
jgi:hypothetical protein